jgi:hypothetical protein
MPTIPLNKSQKERMGGEESKKKPKNPAKINQLFLLNQASFRKLIGKNIGKNNLYYNFQAWQWKMVQYSREENQWRVPRKSP